MNKLHSYTWVAIFFSLVVKDAKKEVDNKIVLFDFRPFEYLLYIRRFFTKCKTRVFWLGWAIFKSYIRTTFKGTTQLKIPLIIWNILSLVFLVLRKILIFVFSIWLYACPLIVIVCMTSHWSPTQKCFCSSFNHPANYSQNLKIIIIAIFTKVQLKSNEHSY
jgi:hypothetical protein